MIQNTRDLGRLCLRGTKEPAKCVKRRVGKRGLEGVSYMIRHGYKWKTVKEEIDKCEVRCRNCHKERTWEQNNYWKEFEEITKNNGTNRKGAS